MLIFILKLTCSAARGWNVIGSDNIELFPRIKVHKMLTTPPLCLCSMVCLESTT